MKKDLVSLQKDFVNMRLGMFIHFNSATYQFNRGEIVDWEYGHENDGLPRQYPFDPKDFNPVKLDCRQWARAAKAMGARFSALTAKHHEGFDLWPRRYTGHCVKPSPVKTDVVRESLDAFRAEGIKAGLYFSFLDLTHQINRKKCTPADKELIKNQLTELLTGYGEIPFLIIDGWNAPWGGPSYENLPFEEVDGWVKEMQPNCLLMNIGGFDGLAHTDIAFYENAAGQEVDAGFEGPGASCNILTDQWFWRADDPEKELKSADWALSLIEEMNRKNVSFILNASPNTDGRIDENLMARYEEIGRKVTFPAPVDELPKGWLYRR